MQETEPYTVRLPGGRTITRQIPRGASDAQIRDAFRTPLARAGYDVSRSPILPGSQPVRERVQPRPLTRDPSNPTPNALAREYRPTWGQWLGDKVNALAEPVFGTTTANRMREEVSYVPFLGDAYMAGEGVSNLQRGDIFTGLGDLGIAAVGAVPAVGDAAAAGLRVGGRRAGGMFGGRGAHLPQPSTLNLPRTPTAEEMARAASVQRIPLSQARHGNRLEWERFNRGDHGQPLVTGYADRPVAAQLENGEFILLDGNHRAALASQQGAAEMEMYVIPARLYDPANAGRRPVPPSISDDDLYRELMGR